MSDAVADFHPCPVLPGCPDCAREPKPTGHISEKERGHPARMAEKGGTPNLPSGSALATCEPLSVRWPFVDAVYCISLRERPERTQSAADRLHALGLCGRTTFHRPTKPATGPTGVAIWESHRAAARHALACGARTALILEDDFVIARPRSAESRTNAAFQRLPPGWNALFLGHWPLSGYFTAPGLLKTRSGCAHAYILNRPLLEWLDAFPIPDRMLHPLVGKGIDAAYASFDGMYALFPMIAVQSGSPSDCINARFYRSGRPRPLTNKFRYRDFVIHRCMRPAEWLCAILSPLHWTCERLGLNTGVQPRDFR